MNSKKYICSCYFNRNIFLKTLNLHVVYLSKSQFINKYSQILAEKGYSTETQLNLIVEQINIEINRRKANGSQSLYRKNSVSASYQPLHPEIYNLNDCYLDIKFLSIIEYVKQSCATKDGLIKMIGKTTASDVYTLPVFTEQFCQTFVEELKHFESSDLPKGRPNSMNKHGVLLEELGFYTSFMNVLRDDYLSPLAALLYPECIGEAGLDSQRAFVVSYHHDKNSDDTDLDLHYDNAEVTLNISLNKEFVGGELYFSGMRKELCNSYSQISHSTGQGIFHRGQHLHGAMPLESGERYNLIIWMRSSSIRNGLCPMCDLTPSLVVTEGDGDGFTILEQHVDVCAVV